MEITVRLGDNGAQIAGESEDVVEILRLLDDKSIPEKDGELAPDWFSKVGHYSTSKRREMPIGAMETNHIRNALIKNTSLTDYDVESILENEEYRALMAELIDRAQRDYDDIPF